MSAAAPAPRVIARGVAPEAPARLTLPAPDALGIRAAAPPRAGADVQTRLAHLGATRYEADRLPLGVYRVSFLLPRGSAAPHQVDAVAESEAAAAQLALGRAEALASAR